jgi:23S rRNA (cytosine1962-C5)-methyltransferase
MLSETVEPIDRGFFQRRIGEAAAYRDRVVRDTTAYRLVYGEADRLPGLILDRFAGCVVMQTLDQGMDRAAPLILDCVGELFAPDAVVARNDLAVRSRESLPLETRVLSGELPLPVTFRMNGFDFEADLLRGQKTGSFLDQRENYVAAARYAHGRALDCFTSSGGFALHLASRCDSVEAVDSSAEALATARANCERNRISNIEFREANVFDFLASAAAAGRRFSTIVLDPPAFAKSRANLASAARGYKEINLRALRMLPAGGVLVTCSCSHHVSEAELLEIVAAAGLDAGRMLRVLERRTQSQDHPILLTVPETHYLKCLVLEAL